jgi:5-formyltetrahydrofolate cyclo-ligase
MIQNITKAKGQLRAQIRSDREQRVLKKSKIIFSEDVVAKLVEHPKLKVASKVAVFFPTDLEPNIRQIAEYLQKLGLTTYIPRVNGESLDWGEFSADISQLEYQGNLLAPKKIINPAPTFDVIIAPALAVDLNGNRLGQGGAHYDRVLKSSKAFKIAVVFDEEFLPSDIPVEPHDQKVDAVLTPTKFLELN